MGILEGKNILVTGVLTEGSIAFDVARLCQEQGATVVLTGVGRTFKITQAMGRRLPVEAPVVELDVTDPAHLEALADRVREHVPHLDGVVHSIGFAPQSVMGGNFMSGEWEDVSTAVHISAYSLKALAQATQPLLTGGGSIVGLTFDGRFAWPVYDWMGVAKAAFEAVNRYVATWVRSGSAATSCLRDRSRPPRPSTSPDSTRWRAAGRSARRSAGIPPRPSPPLAP